MTFETEHPNPAKIYRALNEHLNRLDMERQAKDNLNIVIDFHWFFLQSKRHKSEFGLKNPSGKWKYYAASTAVFQASVFRFLPLAAAGELPLVKFTNTGNVFTREKEIVAYCFPSGPAKAGAEGILEKVLGGGIVWGDAG